MVGLGRCEKKSHVGFFFKFNISINFIPDNKKFNIKILKKIDL